MNDSQTSGIPVKQLILVPALITLAVTLLRLVGELMNWSPLFFNRSAGGGGAVVGIAWLPPIFGIYFGLKLARAGFGPIGTGRAIGYPLLALALVVGSTMAAVKVGLIHQPSVSFLIWLAVASLVGAWIATLGWPALGKVAVAYALAARIPVALIMLIAMLGAWGTHYDVAPPDLPEMGIWPRWMLIGLIPQLTGWIGYTVVLVTFFGAFAAAVAHRPRPATA